VPITIRVQNFQSIKDATVVVDGFTVVTGANNSGKSALMRAVRAAFQNTRGTSFIRHGADKCIVDIDFGDGKTLKWEKGRGKGDKPTYVINGGKPLYPGQGVPDEVLKMGVRPITVGKDDVWPQFAPQFTGQLFLINQPGSVLAEAVSDVDKVSQLNQALRLTESDKRAASVELKIRRIDEETQTLELSRFKGLDNLVSEVSDLEAQGVQIVRIEKALASAKDLQDRLFRSQKAVDDLAGVDLVAVPPEDQSSSLVSILEDIGSMTDLETKLSRSRRAVDALSGIDHVGVPSDTDLSSLGSLLDDLKIFQGLKDQWTRAVRQETHWQLCLDAGGVEGDLDSSMIDRYLQALQMVEGLRDRYLSVVQKVDLEEDEIKKAEEAVAKADEELKCILDGMEDCPLCGSTLNHSH